MSFSQPLTLTFFGISGSGKGTQADLLTRFLEEKDPSRKVLRMEMGAELRAFMQGESELAKRTREVLDSGGLLPSFMPTYILTRFLDAKYSGTEHIVLDGTPRRSTQSELVDETVRFLGRETPQAIVLELSAESARARLLGRGSARADDAKEDAMQKRFAWYREHVLPSVATLEKLGWTIHRVDGEPSIEAIHQEILKRLALA